MPSCQKGRGLQLRAWLIVGGASARLLGLKVCVCGPRAPISGPAPLAVVRRLRPRCPGGRRVLRRLSPVASLWGWVACALQPHGLSGSRVGGASEGGCGGGGWGAGVWWAGSRAQARGQLATVRHAHRVSTQLKPTQQASGLFLASVARKPSPVLTQPSAGKWRLQATCATRCI